MVVIVFSFIWFFNVITLFGWVGLVGACLLVGWLVCVVFVACFVGCCDVWDWLLLFVVGMFDFMFGLYFGCGLVVGLMFLFCYF